MGKLYKKRERGDGAGLSYAMFLIGIMVTMVIWCSVNLNANLYLVRDEIQSKLHIVENYCLVVTHRYYSGDDKDRLSSRRHIVTACKEETSTMSQAQIRDLFRNDLDLVGNSFSERFKEEFGLDTHSRPTIGMLGAQVKHNEKLNIVSVHLYEPIYEEVIDVDQLRQIVLTLDLDEDEMEAYIEECLNGSRQLDGDIDINVTSNIIGWVDCTLLFNDNNDYIGYEVSDVLHTAPTLSNGRRACGATIEATAGTTIKGFPQMFPEYYQKGGGYKETSDKASEYPVYVTQSVDVVLVSKDDRKFGY